MQESIKIPDAVVISGLTDTETDKQLEEYLTSFGSVHRIFRIDTLDYPNHCIVEFTHGTAMQALAPLLPLTYTSPTKPEVTYKVVSLDRVYSPLACNSAAKAYMEELQQIAKLSAKPFEVLFMEQLVKLSSQVSQPEVKSELESGQFSSSGVTPEVKIQQVPPPLPDKFEGNKDPPKETTDAVSPAAQKLFPPSLPNATFPPSLPNAASPHSLISSSATTSFFAPPTTVKKQPPSHSFLSGDMLNPPEIQKVVVKRAGELPVYTVKPEGKDGPLRTLHRDLLLPCGFLPVSEPVAPVIPSPPRRPPTCGNPGLIKDSKQEDDFHSGSDSDDSVRYDEQPKPSTITKVYKTHPPRQPAPARAAPKPAAPKQPVRKSHQRTPLTSSPRPFSGGVLVRAGGEGFCPC